MKTILIICVMALCTLSCSDRTEVVNVDRETVQQSSNHMFARDRTPGSINIGIFEVTIHRASRGCLSGFGFCRFQWFPGFNEPEIPAFQLPEIKSEEMEDLAGRRTVNVFKSEIGEYYFDVFATEELADVQDLIVDEDIVAEKEGTMDKELTLKTGVYSFDYTLGEFGGFRIYLE